MGQRLDLHTLLEEITPHVYFQAPSNIRMQYPCIMYALDSDTSEFAGNAAYLHVKRYQVTVVDRDPDSLLPDLVRALPMCRFDRAYVADDLNHFVFHLFF